MASDSFKYPDLAILTPVEVCVGSDWVNPMMGLVMKPMNSSADILYCNEQGWQPLSACFHRDDPRIKTSPQKFDPDFLPTGIFQLSAGEKLNRTLTARVIGIENFLEQVAADNVRLRNKVNELTEKMHTLEEAVRAGIAPKRGPGRPSTKAKLVEPATA